MLNDVDLSATMADFTFKYVRRYLRQRLYDLEKIAFDHKVPTVIIFEGWDGAGKGATIQELTRRLDPRGFKVHTTTAPRTHETKLPWLWRFWLKIPRHGELALFDRSWYRRVTIERVEAAKNDVNWLPVYQEINDFERLLADDGAVFIKFWLHISEEEQLRRFIKLRQDPEDFWQVTEAYWQRHRRYQEYYQCANQMLLQTHTAYAPWTVIAATDPNHRDYTVYKTIIDRLETTLNTPQTHWLSLEELETMARLDRKKK
jgi:polyphosphate kinase 2 (PPK2 family)